ncbi:unnamed protein product [Colias eurytheme]|nr:unnamed protein product [Colias eurytheme]
MAYFGKTYVEEKSENYEAFVRSLKIPDEVVDMVVKSKTKQKIEKNGDEYVLTLQFNDRNIVLNFKSGVEFEESVGPKGISKTTFTVDGNKFTQVQKFQDGIVVTSIREYYPDKLDVTMTTTSWPGTVKRYFVAE